MFYPTSHSRNQCAITKRHEHGIECALLHHFHRNRASTLGNCDVATIFNFLTGAARTSSYQRILVAPDHLRSEIGRRIERLTKQARTGAATSITIKVNALIDPEMIAALDRAAEAGVSMDLIVRGMCGLLPSPERHGTASHAPALPDAQGFPSADTGSSRDGLSQNGYGLSQNGYGPKGREGFG